MVFIKDECVIWVKPCGNKFIVKGRRSYLNDSPKLVMVLMVLLRRGFRETTLRSLTREKRAMEPQYVSAEF
jgi:hypothetical protein